MKRAWGGAAPHGGLTEFDAEKWRVIGAEVKITYKN
jgi:hypothetical protein